MAAALSMQHDLMFSRRGLIGAAAALPIASQLAAAVGDDEAYWRSIAAQYDVTPDVIQLENGNWGMMARPVLAAYAAQVARVNRQSSFYARRGMNADLDAVRGELAREMGVGDEEVALTRNATEALTSLILGYNRLKPGDGVLYADLDYDSMQSCMESLRERRGVTVTKIALPEPATRAALIAAYRSAFDANPRIRLVLLTHLSHRTGLVLPIRELVALARARGVDAIVDAAHSWQQLDFRLSDLDADFVGVNCHKWLGNPLGVGAIHVRAAALDRIDRHPANPADMPDTIEARIHTGTVDYAAQLTLPAALAFQRGIGAARRAARLVALRDLWVSKVRDHPRIEVLTPDDPALHGGITSFRIAGLTSEADNKAVAKRLLDQHGIFTVHRTGVAKGACVRVTPAVFNMPGEMDRLARALVEIA
jgi:isopenicillin-N epimerase